MSRNHTYKVINYINKKLEENKLHFSLIDPEKIALHNNISKLAKKLEEIETDLILVGGSAGYSQEDMDNLIKELKQEVSIPIVIFPGDLFSVSKYADAILFISLLNSRNTYYLIEAQAKGAIIIKKYGLEAIPVGYIIIEPGETVGFIGDAKAIPRHKPEIAAMYALAAEYLGMKFVYLEAGSGAKKPVPSTLVKYVKNFIDIPLIVGGGIKEKDHVKRLIEAGADIIVTGTLIEKDKDLTKLRDIVKVIKKS